MGKEAPQAKDLLKTSKILKSSYDKTLKEALTLISRSHDAVFVFNKKNKFLGVVNPYYAIFKSNFPSGTKLINCVFKPPSISLGTNIWDIARLMHESKIYFLPVFKNSNFEGIVTINRVFKAALKKGNLAKKRGVKTKKNLLVIQKDATLMEAYNLLRDKQVARLPVVGRRGKLAGIVTRFDLRAALSEPREKVSWLSRAGDKKKYLSHPLEGYYKKIVVVASPNSTVEQLMKKMLEKKVGSVVIVDNNGKPVGIISNYDILKAISKLKPKKGAEVDLKIDKRFIHKVRLEQILSRFVLKVGKFSAIRRAGFIVGIIKNPAGKIKRYTVRAHLFLKNGKEVVAKVTAYDWKKAVRKTLNKIRSQLPS